jgi:benzoyl-CoA reductase/2-hydroxyglutaryl-CoA dehydratase subunit BcrC/BadD/HgdB
MPVWGRVSALDGLFKSLGTAVVASTYCSSWVFDVFDPDAPFESMAEAYTALFVVRSDNAKRRYLENAVARYQIDGIIYHEAKTCPANSNTRYGLPERLARATTLPYTIVYGDHVNNTLFDEARVALQLEAMTEQMASEK